MPEFFRGLISANNAHNQVETIDQRHHLSLRVVNAAGIVLLAFSILWAFWTYFAVRAYGVTASDPYAYVQMAADLAEHGKLTHTFALSRLTEQANLNPAALVPLGYRIPDSSTGEAATVWAPGYSVWLASAYLLGGEITFYMLTPLFGLLSLVAVTFLAWQVVIPGHLVYRWLAVAIAVFVLATSHQQLLWVAVPMADIPSQFFTTLCILFALVATRTTGKLRPFLAGLCLGIAFTIRYTQVLVSLAVVIGWSYKVYQKQLSVRQLVQMLIWTGIGAWAAAIPVLLYHWATFGDPFHVGSGELTFFSWHYIDDSAWRMISAAFDSREFLWISPFIAWGIVSLWKHNRFASLLFNLWFLTIVLFHLPYTALRLRDLLSIFPVLAIYAGIGAVDLVSRLNNSIFQCLPGTTLVMVVLLTSLWVRTDETLNFISGNFNNFGYLNRDQRQAFEILQDVTEEDSIIAASLNCGAVLLYSQREIVRPYDWTSEEWLRFIEITQPVPLYLLVDGVDMEPVFDNTSQRYTLELVSHLKIPYFFVGAGSENRAVALYRVKRV